MCPLSISIYSELDTYIPAHSFKWRYRLWTASALPTIIPCANSISVEARRMTDSCRRQMQRSLYSSTSKDLAIFNIWSDTGNLEGFPGSIKTISTAISPRIWPFCCRVCALLYSFPIKLRLPALAARTAASIIPRFFGISCLMPDYRISPAGSQLFNSVALVNKMTARVAVIAGDTRHIIGQSRGMARSSIDFSNGRVCKRLDYLHCFRRKHNRV